MAMDVQSRVAVDASGSEGLMKSTIDTPRPAGLVQDPIFPHDILERDRPVTTKDIGIQLGNEHTHPYADIAVDLQAAKVSRRIRSHAFGRIPNVCERPAPHPQVSKGERDGSQI